MKVKDALTTVGLTKYPERLRITKIEKLCFTSPLLGIIIQACAVNHLLRFIRRPCIVACIM